MLKTKLSNFVKGNWSPPDMGNYAVLDLRNKHLYASGHSREYVEDYSTDPFTGKKAVYLKIVKLPKGYAKKVAKEKF